MVLHMVMQPDLLADDLAGLHLVAKDNCSVDGQQSHLLTGDNYVYPETSIPLNVVGKNAPARSIVFAEEITLTYFNVRKDSSYVAKLMFLSDSDQRHQKILIDGKVVKEIFSLPKNEIVSMIIDVPKEACSNGTFRLTVVKLKGLNAVCSMVEIFSDKKHKLQPKEVSVPRLSPYSAPLPGHKIIQKRLDGTWKFNPNPPAGFHSLKSIPADWKNITVLGEWVMQGFDVKKIEMQVISAFSLFLKIGKEIG